MMAMSYEQLNAERNKLLQQRQLLCAVVCAVLDGVKDHEVKEETGLPLSEVEVVLKVRTKAAALLGTIGRTTPLTEFGDLS